MGARAYILASSTDKLDGWVARKYNLVTTFGKFLDPLADKLLVLSALICLTWYGRCSPYISILVLMRELVVTSFSHCGDGQWAGACG